MKSATLTRIWLLFVAAYPITIGTFQVIHFLSWLLEWDLAMTAVHCNALYSPPIIAIFLVVSLRERFCIYHRLCLVATFLLNTNHLWITHTSPIIANSISSALAIAIFIGIIGSLIHFIYQIQDFIRYVRIESTHTIESKKQDTNQRTLSTLRSRSI